MDGEARHRQVDIDAMVVRVLGWSAPVLLLTALLSPFVLPDLSREENRDSEGFILVPFALGLLSVVAAVLAILTGGVLLAVRRQLPLQMVVPMLLSALVLVVAAVVMMA